MENPLPSKSAAPLAAGATALAPESRIVGVDVLRGFALLGILMVNASLMAGVPEFHQGDSKSNFDHFAEWFVAALFETKFYLLFSFLFGYSFVLQMRAYQRAEMPLAVRHLRRLVGLILIGASHAILLYPGDILTTYGVLGFALFGIRRIHPRVALLVAAALFVFLAVAFLATGVMAIGIGDATDSAELDSGPNLTDLYRGDVGDVIAANITMVREMLVGAIMYSAHIFGAFLIGLAAAQYGVLDRVDSVLGKWRRRTLGVCVVGLVLGVPGAVLMAMIEFGPLSDRYYYLGRAVSVLTAPALTALYVCCLFALLRSRLGIFLGRPLAAAGRMSLTNYLGQSLVLAVIFTGYGFAQYGKVGPAALVLICLLIYSAQLAFSTRLMDRRRYGPMEALLRRITGPQ
ncbi:DUF418 domain-containing protein [Streptomyces sp. WAC 01325]|uniref:DUF418 domain-containing protein n=1 Tax=Streptomyces sp. WAC 01325 TaxID=2203202 RepID=UPI000F87400F|nr:DUF418 domain-containing protein [Streptomyces sp. WAC 01325]